MKRTIRSILALILVLSLFVSFGALTAFASEPPPSSGGGENKTQAKLFDSMTVIGWIKVLKQTYVVDGATYFVKEVAKNVKYRLPAVPEKEGDPAVGWQASDGTMYQGGERAAISENTTFTAVYESDLNTVDPNEAGMKTQLRE